MLIHGLKNALVAAGRGRRHITRVLMEILVVQNT